MKKIITSALIMSLLSTNVFAFSDVLEESWYHSDVNKLFEQGIVGGYGDDTFKPLQDITTGEVLKIVITSLYGEVEATSSSHWAEVYKNKAIELGYMNDSSINLSENASRQFIFDLIFNSLGIDKINIVSPFFDVDNDIINTLNMAGIVLGSTNSNGLLCVYPENNITRAEVCAIVVRAMNFKNSYNNLEKVSYVIPTEDLIIYQNPKTISEFENILLHMAYNNVYTYTIEYTDISYSELSANYNINNVISQAFVNVFDKYTEILGFYDYLQNGYQSYQNSSQNDKLILNFNNTLIGTENLSVYQDISINYAENVVNVLYASGKISNDMSQYELARYFYEWVCVNKKYDTTIDGYSYNPYGLVRDNEGVCQAYVGLYNTMCKLVGIEITGFSGKIGNIDHIWSQAILDGKTTLIDVTYGDPIPDREGYSNFYYFDISESDLRQTHSW